VAAAGNSGVAENQPSYPAALLFSHGLAVGASTAAGLRASFSTVAPYVAMAAPGLRVLGALSATASPSTYPRVTVLGATTGVYGFGSGTSYSAPQVAGAAALVWAADSISTPPRPLRWQAGCPHPRRFECPSRRTRRFHATL